MASRLHPSRAASVLDGPDRSMRTYIGSVMAGAVVTLLLMMATVAALNWRNALPPPQFSNNLCMDEKLRFMKVHSPGSANLLVVGSSAAFRHFNSPAAIQANPELRPYNSGACGQDMAQTAQMTEWLLGRIASARRVILFVTPRDFRNCAIDSGSRFDVADVDAYVFGGQSAWPYYLRYFDPVTFLQNAWELSNRRSDMRHIGPLIMNRFGDGPSDPGAWQGLRFGEIRAFDPHCFAALSELAWRTNREGVALTIVLSPVHPAWLKSYDRDGRLMTSLRDSIAAATSRTGVRLLDKHQAVPDRDFYDAMHFRWSSTDEFTRAILFG